MTPRGGNKACLPCPAPGLAAAAARQALRDIQQRPPTPPIGCMAAWVPADECVLIKVLLYNPRDVGRAAELLRVGAGHTHYCGWPWPLWCCRHCLIS